MPSVGKRTLVEQIPGQTAAPLLPQVSHTKAPSAAVQRKPEGPSAASGGAGPAVTPPKGGINKTGKEAATDVPSWIDEWPDARPGVNESGTTFATRMMNKKYGVGAGKEPASKAPSSAS